MAPEKSAEELEFKEWLVRWFAERHQVKCAGCGTPVDPKDAFDSRGCLVNDRCVLCQVDPPAEDDPEVLFMARALDTKPW